jgi:CubicO group peptidase (beta-lactamase class C family)
VLTAWLDAFNSGDVARVREFDRVHGRPAGQPAPPPQATVAFREQTGGFKLIRFEKQEPRAAIALLQERDGDTIARLEMTVSEAEPPQVVSRRLMAIPRPADLALPRMSERDAIAALSSRVDELANADRFSGVVLVARDGKVLLEKVAGLANREAKTPVTADTRFRIGSMNKMFTSVTTLQLMEAGKLSLDDTIGKHLTDYPNAEVASAVTIRHLLTHTGGTGDIFGPEFERNRLTLREHRDYLKLYGARGLTHAPGAQFRYSNYGFVLLGAIIERVSGLPYYDAVRKSVFEKAGMTGTDSLPEAESVAERSTGYMRREGTWLPNTDTLPWRGTAAGGGYSTARDLLRFAQALESGKLISRRLLAEATTGHKDGYGYGFTIRDEGGVRWYGHGGGAPGMNGELRIVPALGYVLVGLANLDPPAASRPIDFVMLRLPAQRSSS